MVYLAVEFQVLHRVMKNNPLHTSVGEALSLQNIPIDL